MRHAAPALLVALVAIPVAAHAERIANPVAEFAGMDKITGRLITFDGDGHTAYGRSNDCVDDAINDYYVKGTPPKDNTTC